MNNPYAPRIDKLTRACGMKFTDDLGRFFLAWLKDCHPLAADDVEAMLKKYRAAYATGLGKLPDT